MPIPHRLAVAAWIVLSAALPAAAQEREQITNAPPPSNMLCALAQKHLADFLPRVTRQRSADDYGLQCMFNELEEDAVILNRSGSGGVASVKAFRELAGRGARDEPSLGDGAFSTMRNDSVSEVSFITSRGRDVVTLSISRKGRFTDAEMDKIRAGFKAVVAAL